MQLSRVATACFSALVLASCATTAEQMNQRAAALPEATRAYIIGTYAVDCTPRRGQCEQAFNSISTQYRGTDDKDLRGSFTSVVGKMFGGDSVYDFDSQELGEKGFYFCMALPPGTYVVYTYGFTNFAGGGSGYSLPSESYFKLPFSVSAGEVINLGKLKVTSTKGRSLIGLPVRGPGVLLLSGTSRDAAEAAMTKCPESVRSKPIRDALLSAAYTGDSAFVRVEPPR